MEVAACGVCGASLDRHARAVGIVCNRLACKATLAVREQDRRRRSRQADLDAAASRLGADLVDGAVVGAMPYYDPALAPADPARVSVFVASLRRAARGALSRARDADPPPQQAEPPADGDDRVLRTACAVCGGKCCAPGATHAFLTSDELASKLASLRPRSARALVETYAARLPERSYEGSCVYHAEHGCALPRSARGTICNEYRCNALVDLAVALEATPSRHVLIASVDDGEVRRALVADREG